MFVKTTLARQLAALFALTGALTACTGGGGGNANQAPQAQNDSASTRYGVAVSIDALANDRDPDGALQISKVGTASNGTVEIKDGKLRYTPKAGFVGNDSFSYTVRDGGGLEASATVQVEVQASLQALGYADVSLAGSTVNASLCGKTVSSALDSKGAFTLNLSCNDLKSAVQLEVQGKNGVKLQSYLGNMAELLQQAGNDGIMDSGDNASLAVSPLSTALHVATLSAIGQTAPSDEDYRSGQPFAINEPIGEMAAAIKLVMGGEALPSGVSDTVKLISDIPSYNSFMQRFSGAQQSKLTDTANALFLADALPTEKTASGIKTLLNLYPSGMSSGLQVKLESNGSATVTNDDEAGNVLTSAKWSIKGGAITLVLDKPLKRVSEQMIPGSSRTEWMDVTVKQIELRRFGGDGQIQFYAMHEQGTMQVEYDPNNPVRTQYPYAAQARSLFSKSEQATLAITTEDLSSGKIWGIPATKLPTYMPVDATVSNSLADLLELTSAGGCNLLRSQMSCTYTLEGGKLKLTFGNNSVMTLARIHRLGGRDFWRMDYQASAVGNSWVNAGLVTTSSGKDGFWGNVLQSNKLVWQSATPVGGAKYSFQLKDNVMTRSYSGNGRDMNDRSFDSYFGYLPNVVGAPNVVELRQFHALSPSYGRSLPAICYQQGYGGNGSGTAYRDCRFSSARFWSPIGRSGNLFYLMEQVHNVSWDSQFHYPMPGRLAFSRLRAFEITPLTTSASTAPAERLRIGNAGQAMGM